MGFCFYHEDDHDILWKTVLLGTVMYRTILNSNKIALLSLSVFLTACGQTGSLQLANDVNVDKRAKYLIYPDQPTRMKEQSQKSVATTHSSAASEAVAQ